MQKITFTENLAHNIALMQSVFEGDDTFIVREATGRNGLHCAMFFFDGMVDSFTINESLVRPVLLSDRRRASADELAGRILQADDCRVETDMDKALAAFLYGDTLVLTEGDARALVVNTKGFARRSPEEPENERVLSGPREGFTECFMPNLALIRRRVRDTRLKFNFLRVGGRTNTAVCLCYIDGLCPAPLVDEMRTRLSVLELDSVLDANYIAECLCDHRFSPFPTLGTTERPDVAASRLLEGRCALVVDGSPVVLTAPHLLQECFQSNDDYYISFLRTNISRVLRTLGFFCSVTIPAVYTALLLYHRELVPARLLFAITAAQRGVPLPVGWEVLLLLFVLEVLREAGVKPDVTAGLSLGEYCAIASAGGMQIEDAILAVRKRGILMQNAVPDGKGAMAAVLGLDAEKIEAAIAGIEGVSIANYNCPGQIVITGWKESVEQARAVLKDAGAKRVLPLNVSGPFHSPMLQEAAGQLKEVLDQIECSPLQIPYVTNVTGRYVSDIEETKELLIQQIAAPVRWQQSVEEMIRQGVDTFVEIGPGRTLSGFLRKINRDVKVYQVSTWEDIEKAGKELC